MESNCLPFTELKQNLGDRKFNEDRGEQTDMTRWR